MLDEGVKKTKIRWENTKMRGKTPKRVGKHQAVDEREK